MTYRCQLPRSCPRRAMHCPERCVCVHILGSVLRRLCHSLRQMSLPALLLQQSTCITLNWSYASGNLAHGLCSQLIVRVCCHDCLPAHNFHLSLVVCRVARSHAPRRFLSAVVCCGVLWLNMGSIQHIGFHSLCLWCPCLLCL